MAVILRFTLCFNKGNSIYFSEGHKYFGLPVRTSSASGRHRGGRPASLPQNLTAAPPAGVGDFMPLGTRPDNLLWAA
eukprot:scaffold136512_cov20-Tisochrysis_lutea.AAC.1